VETSTLINGKTYYRLTFADRDLTMPGVEPLVFLKQAADEGGTSGFVFQDTLSYVLHGSGLEGEEQHEDIEMYFMQEEDARSLYDVEELALAIAAAAQRAVSLNFPSLTCLRDGWKSAP
jgi:hypothetical protein